jgi:hypothetical protein
LRNLLGKDNFVSFITEFQPLEQKARIFPFIQVVSKEAVAKTILVELFSGKKIIYYSIIIPFIYEN